jgi:hypothetical protein
MIAWRVFFAIPMASRYNHGVAGDTQPNYKIAKLNGFCPTKFPSAAYMGEFAVGSALPESEPSMHPA